jgi:DNA polymerase-3 subunit gamma/tau
MFYLKYRPRTINQIDNTRVRDILQKILEAGEIPHALLFVGSKGTGKTSSARILAKAINCESNKFAQKGTDFEPCNKCKNCLSIDVSSYTDVLEMDAASNRGIEEVKNLIREVAFMPMSGRYRVFIIDEAHMITPDGFNALLKTLEEPPKSAIFILATTNIEKVPATIVSRCVKVNFGRGKNLDLINMLKRIVKSEALSFSDEMLAMIAAQSDYSFRDAAKLLEEASQQKITKIEDLEIFLGLRGRNDLMNMISIKDQKKTFIWISEFAEQGGNFKILIESLLSTLRQEFLIKKGVVDKTESKTNLKTSEVTRLIKLLVEAYQLMRSTPIESLPLEIAVGEFYNELSD